MRDIPNTRCITQFMHCRQCLLEKPPSVSAGDWARLEVGMTPLGLQVWCRRHHINVMHLDLEGREHRCNFTFVPPATVALSATVLVSAEPAAAAPAPTKKGDPRAN